MKNPTKRQNVDKLMMLKESGMKIPSLENLPEIEPLNQMFWDAFQYLSKRRIINEAGPQPIQVSEILAYAELFGIDDPSDRDDLGLFVPLMDKIWIDDAYDKKKKASDKAKREAKSKRR